MDNLINSSQLQYQGYLKTPILWEGDLNIGLVQLILNTGNLSCFNEEFSPNLRLGKRVERFVSHELKQDSSILIIAENIQIHNNKITLGELDCLFEQNKNLIHVEVVYKFYLYDISAGSSELEHWIGPNRKDSLSEKITKLKEKQLPIIHHPETQKYLRTLPINRHEIIQKVYFKAQLFVPISMLNSNFFLINNQCVSGFYISIGQLDNFSDCEFIIPSKIDWLVSPYLDVNWLVYKDFKTKITSVLQQKNSPLCWLKNKNGKLQKFFMVWWE